MRKIFVACTTLALIGCGVSSKTDFQRQAAVSFMACLHKTTHELDDHRSDAAALGGEVAQKCSDERDATAAVLNDGPIDVSTAIAVVLYERNRDSN